MVSILERLERVRKTGSDKYVARCPAHADKSPSLSVREMSDGRVLIHCFGGCETADVLAAVGLTFRDVMPERVGDFPRARPAFTATDALRALAREAGIVAIAVADLNDGKAFDDADKSRIAVAAGRITSALEFVYGD
jgi:hypothetical protein